MRPHPSSRKINHCQRSKSLLSSAHKAANLFRSITTYAPLVTVLIISFAFPACEANDTAKQTMQATVNSVLVILRHEGLSDDQKKHQVAAVVDQRFDFEAMTSRVLATNWKRANAAQKSRLIILFRNMLDDTYWQKISRYQQENVEFIGDQIPSGDRVTCRTLIKTAKTDIPIDYKLYQKDNSWFVYDVVIEHVSLVRNYRGKFQTIVRESGIEGLIKHLESAQS